MGQLIGAFVTGAILINGVPHFVQGICGKRHMTPFARESHPVVNVIWGSINFALAGYLKYRLDLHAAAGDLKLAMLAGGFLTAVGLAWFWSHPNARLPWHSN